MAAEIRFPAMGSEAHVIVAGDPRLLGMARARIEELERRWSRFIPTSEVSFLNSHRGASSPVSLNTFRLVNRAITGWRDTGGRFDPTVLGGPDPRGVRPSVPGGGDQLRIEHQRAAT